VKHAGDKALDALEPILLRLRGVEGLRERKRGAFYRKSAAFVHFHEDPAGLFADLKCGKDFVRFPVNTRVEIEAFMRAVKRALAS
jgi:hypothetical protein